MMDRLTERFSNGQAASYWCGSNCKYDHKYCCENLENCPAMEDILEKLAHYEDLEEAGMAIEALKEPERKWIPVSERLPKNEQEVEVTYVQYHWKTGKPLYYTCRAFYTDGIMNTEDSDYVWDDTDNFEYNESLDAYIIPEGWWEAVSFAEEFCCIDRPVIAWRPLPEPYKAGEQE